MICPNCHNSNDNQVLDAVSSTENLEYDVRTMNCGNCGMTWQTAELPLEDLMVIREIVAKTREFIARVENL